MTLKSKFNLPTNLTLGIFVLQLLGCSSIDRTPASNESNDKNKVMQNLESKSEYDSLKFLTKTVDYLSSPQLSGRDPGTPGHKMAQDYIRSHLKRNNFQVELSHQASMFLPTKGYIQNIYGKLPAINNPGKQCVVMAAHYDHNPPMDGKYSPGANDNASGVAILLDLAQWAGQHGPFDDFDLWLTFPDQEENFITGSHHAAKFLKANCQNILLSITLDLMGVPFFPGFENHLLMLGSESSEALHHLMEDVAEMSLADKYGSLKAMNGPIFMIEPAGIPRSDYNSFRKEKIPFLFLTAGMPATYHTPYDTMEKVDFNFMLETSVMLKDFLGGQLPEYLSLAIADPTLKVFDFKESQSIPLKDVGQRLTGILELLLSQPEKNQLTEKEQQWLNNKIIELNAESSHPTKWELQMTVIKVIMIVSRQSPMKAAYLKSLIGKFK